jgi:Arc/MetJ-type ribon-helix-helix transcriptional regulator
MTTEQNVGPEIKTKSAGKRKKAITIRLPAVLVEAIDELVEIGFYTSRTVAIRSILAQEVPRHLRRYQAIYQDTDENSKDDDGSKRKNVSVYMTKRMFANLLTMAEMLEVSKSELIRIAVDHFFREYGEVYRK